VRTNSSAARLYNAKGFLELNQYNAYCVNNITAKKKRRRLGRSAVWGLRRQDSELLADHDRLELHGTALSPARRSLEPEALCFAAAFPRKMLSISTNGTCKFSRGAARELTSVHRRRRVRNGVVAVVRYAGLGRRTIKSPECLKSASGKCLRCPFC
jgi:hypothetical protein